MRVGKPATQPKMFYRSAREGRKKKQAETLPACFACRSLASGEETCGKAAVIPYRR